MSLNSDATVILYPRKSFAAVQVFTAAGFLLIMDSQGQVRF